MKVVYPPVTEVQILDVLPVKAPSTVDNQHLPSTVPHPYVSVQSYPLTQQSQNIPTAPTVALQVPQKPRTTLLGAVNTNSLTLIPKKNLYPPIVSSKDLNHSIQYGQ